MIEKLNIHTAFIPVNEKINIFFSTRLKIGQKFMLPAELWPLKKNFQNNIFCESFDNFWLFTLLEGQNFKLFAKNFFVQQKYLFSSRRLKIGQKFVFPAEFWPLKKIFQNNIFVNFLHFFGIFWYFLVCHSLSGRKFRTFCPKIFYRPKYAQKFCIGQKLARNLCIRSYFGT